MHKHAESLGGSALPSACAEGPSGPAHVCAESLGGSAQSSACTEGHGGPVHKRAESLGGSALPSACAEGPSGPARACAESLGGSAQLFACTEGHGGPVRARGETWWRAFRWRLCRGDGILALRVVDLAWLRRVSVLRSCGMCVSPLRGGHHACTACLCPEATMDGPVGWRVL